MEGRNRAPWGYDPGQVGTLILTHAHIDHSGRIPKMVKDGFRGRIVTSPPTAELCEVMLLDSAHVQEMESEWQSRKSRRQARRHNEPLYTTEDAQRSLQYLTPVEPDQIIDIEPGVKARLRNSGHILGSCIVEMWVEDEGKSTKIVFSGDLGKHDQLIVQDPAQIADADYLFVESTYGNRVHRSLEESKAEFLEAIEYAVSNDEKVIIPAFAVERTQEIIYLLGEFSRAGKLPLIPIYLDSPLAIRATEVFRRNRAYFDEDAQAIVSRGFDPFDMPQLKMTLNKPDSMKINDMRGAAIVISANGMCTAGRIKHHLKHNLWRPGASLVITGFQSQGSIGRQIVDGAKTVTLFGEKIAVKAKVFTIGGLSAHADQADLMAWVGRFAEKSRPRVFVVHGEPSSSEAMAAAIRNRFSLEVRAPGWRDVLNLDPRVPAPLVVSQVVPVDLRSKLLELIAVTERRIQQFKLQVAAGEQVLSENDQDKLMSINDDLQELISG
jgi:metallo-beta-lactamase family protein